MSIKASLFVLFACFAVLGCQTPGDGRTVGTTSKYSPQSYTCDGQCKITVTANALCNSPYDCPLDRDPVHLARGHNNINITWSLPPKSVFCTALGDGVFLKNFDDDDQFDQMSEAGNAAGPKQKCKDSYHWRGKNTVSKPYAPYGYFIIFHDEFGNRYVLDPWIHND